MKDDIFKRKGLQQTRLYITLGYTIMNIELSFWKRLANPILLKNVATGKHLITTLTPTKSEKEKQERALRSHSQTETRSSLPLRTPFSTLLLVKPLSIISVLKPIERDRKPRFKRREMKKEMNALYNG
jgi:hypothetical protein